VNELMINELTIYVYVNSDVRRELFIKMGRVLPSPVKLAVPVINLTEIDRARLFPLIKYGNCGPYVWLEYPRYVPRPFDSVEFDRTFEARLIPETNEDWRVILDEWWAVVSREARGLIEKGLTIPHYAVEMFDES